MDVVEPILLKIVDRIPSFLTATFLEVVRSSSDKDDDVILVDEIIFVRRSKDDDDGDDDANIDGILFVVNNVKVLVAISILRRGWKEL
jgi:hypothetical protein